MNKKKTNEQFVLEANHSGKYRYMSEYKENNA